MSLSPEKQIKLLFEMKRIRAYEEGIALKYAENKMRCPTHLSVGQEAVPAAVSLALSREDFAVSTHRGHAHYLGKGGSGPKMIAEIYGKATGCSAGMGGSMHLVDLSVGFKGSTAIVGNTIPIGVGLGLALSLERKPNLSCVFLGEAAVEEGVFYESVNFAAVRKLPVLFVCENNGYSVYTNLKPRQPSDRKIFRMVEAMGIRTSSHDGNDVIGTFEALDEEAKRVRSGEGPAFLEFSTYRWREHCGPNFDNHIGYRTEQEFLLWKGRDPIERHKAKLLRAGCLHAAGVEEMDKRIAAEVDDAFRFADSSPFPAEQDAFKNLFAVERGARHR